MSKESPLILLVDDEPFSRDLVRAELEEAGYGVASARDGVEGWNLFKKRTVDLVITDLRMPRSDGVSLLRRIRSSASPRPQIPVILVSAYGTLSTAVTAGRAGATDFYPLDDQGLESLVERVREILRAGRPVVPASLLGKSAVISDIRKRLAAIVAVRSPVLIQGPPHSGQGDAVTYVHQQGTDRNTPLLRVVCGKQRLSSIAPRGALYLEGIERLPRDSQLRVLDWVRGWGDGAEDVPRVLASTDADLAAKVEKGDFDSALAEWLGRFSLRLPRLADRSDDFPTLVDAFLTRAGHRLGRTVSEVDPEALERLRQHPWPENFRELETVLESLMAFAGTGRIGPDDVEAALCRHQTPLDRIAERRRSEEREQLIGLFRKHGTYSGVARELGISRNAAKYRFAKHQLIPRSLGVRSPAGSDA